MSPTFSDNAEDFILKELSAYQNCLDLGITVPPDCSVEGQPIPEAIKSSLHGMFRCLDLLNETRKEFCAEKALAGASAGLPKASGVSKEIGNFQILECLGMGGFGIVYRAYDRTVRREVAIKVPRMEMLGSADQIDRFQREAAIAAQLDHSNIIQIHECGVHGMIPYIAMRYIAGRNLATWLSEQKVIDPAVAAELVKQLALGVAHAHQHGVYHRDIKPTNVLLAPADKLAANTRLDFVPKLTDFGLAKCLEFTSDQTRTGTIIGTASYIAPELALGKTASVSPETDVYGLGAVLYELLTGIPPFRAETDLLTMQQALHEEPVPVRMLSPQVPEDLSVICLKCLEKNPEDRYRTADELAADLGRFLGGDPIRARPASNFRRLRRLCRRHPGRAVFGVMSVVGIFLLVGISLWHNKSLSRQLKQTEFERDRAETQSTEIRRRVCLADTRLAQIAAAQGNNEQAIRLLEQYFPLNGEKDVRHFAWWHVWKQVTEKTRLLWTHKGRATAVAITREGKLAASGGDDGLIHVLELPSGKLRYTFRENEKGPIQALRFSPDDRNLASAGEDGSVRVWDVNSGQQKFVQINREDWIADVAYSPDGKLLASSGQLPQVRLWDATSGEPRGFFEGHAAKKAVTGLAFHPSEPFLISSSQDGTLRFWDLKTMKPDGRLADGMIRMTKAGDWCRHIVISPDGKSLLGGTTQRELLRWGLEPANFGKVIEKTEESSNVRSLCWPESGGPVLGYTASGIRIADSRKLSWDESRLTRDRQLFFAVAADRTGDNVLSAGSSGEVRLWKPPNLRQIVRGEDASLKNRVERFCVDDFEWSASGPELLIRTHQPENGHLTGGISNESRSLLLGPAGASVRKRELSPSDSSLVKLSPSGKLLVGFGVGGKVFCKETAALLTVWEVSEPELIEGLVGGRKFMEISPDESSVVMGLRNRAIHFSLRDGKVLHRWKFLDMVSSVLIRSQLESGKVVAITCWNGILHLMSMGDGAELRTVCVDPEKRCVSVALSRDGQYLAVGNHQGYAVVRRWKDMSEVRRFSHDEAVCQMDFFDHDHVLLSRDQKLHFWSIADGAELLAIPGADVNIHDAPGDNLLWDRYFGNFSVSPDGHTVAVPRRNEVLFIEALTSLKNGK